MPHPLNQPFPVPPTGPLELKVGATAMMEYLQVFLTRRHQRPEGKFADADIIEFMRLAEHRDKVANIEMKFIASELLRKRKELFRAPSQMTRLRIFVANHKAKNKESKEDDFVESVLELPTIEHFRHAAAMDLILKAGELSKAIEASRAHYARHGEDDPALVAIVDQFSNEIAGLIDGFTLTDVDKPGKKARKAKWRDVANFFRRMTGEVSHEAKWLKGKKQWTNWNREINVFPDVYEGDEDDKDKVLTQAKLAQLIAQDEPVRVVAAGHGFNVTPDTGGKPSARVGKLITLDETPLRQGGQVELLKKADVKRDYGLNDGRHVFRVSAGVRLRDFTEAAWEKGAALPVAGSTDAQSIGGLIASDLHSTGRSNGFLSERLLEVVVLDGSGKRHVFRRDNDIPMGKNGRWKWIQPPHGKTEKLAKLPVAGAMGMNGVAVEAVIQLVKGFAFRKHEQYVERKWFDANVHRFLDPAETDKLFDYEHVSLYLGGGVDPKKIKTVRINSWKRTHQKQPQNALRVKRERELVDHIGSAFLPNTMVKYSQKQAPDPKNNGGDKTLNDLNARTKLVLNANHAFARKLYFQHDEIEVGIPLADKPGDPPDYDRYRDALAATLQLLHEEEFKTIIEVRFTPNASEAMLGPGAGPPTCYIELATALTQYSTDRIREVYRKFDRLLMDPPFNARPHLGKRTSADAGDLTRLYGADWKAFNKVRKKIDPTGKFRPPGNTLLNRLFPRPA